MSSIFLIVSALSWNKYLPHKDLLRLNLLMFVKSFEYMKCCTSTKCYSHLSQ